jgi:hypothetical protein
MIFQQLCYIDTVITWMLDDKLSMYHKHNQIVFCQLFVFVYDRGVV